jgi:hypothetical protein
MGRCRTAEVGGSPFRGDKKGGFVTAFEEEIVAEIETFIGAGVIDSWDMERIEMTARSQALLVAARAVQERLNADTSDYMGPEVPCSCGALARYAGRHSKTFQSVLGLLTLERAYYHCKVCGKGFCPRDCSLGLEGGMLSPGVQRMVGMVGAMSSFEEGEELLRELAGIDVLAKQVEREAEALGREIAKDEREVVEPPPNQVAVASTLYLGLDGTGVPMRASELEGRQGKQPDGSSKTREVKLVTIWSAEGRDKEGVPVRDEGSVSYSAAIESAATRDTDVMPSEFARRAEREAQRRGFNRARRRVIIGDGAPWVWNIADEHFPEAVQIVDRFHAKQKLSSVAKSIYGPQNPRSEEWGHQRHEELDAGDIEAVICALRLHAPQDDEARKCIDYIERNRQRMRYKQFHEEGLCTSSGVVEAGCKTAIGTRCKRAGMHWSVAGVDAIIALRCCKLSDRFCDFWKRRSVARPARDKPFSQN